MIINILLKLNIIFCNFSSVFMRHHVTLISKSPNKQKKEFIIVIYIYISDSQLIKYDDL